MPLAVITRLSNLIGRILLPSALLCILLAGARGAMIAQWNFNSQPPDSSTSTGSTSPSAGTGVAALLGGATGGFAGGCTADPATSDNSGWQTAHYPAVNTNNLSAGVQ